MARADLEDRWDVDRGLESTRKRVLRFLDDVDMKVIEDDDEKIVAKQGSQLKTRLLGGWFVSPESLPKRATIRLRETSEGTRVKAVIEESLGFGILDPILKGKYEKYFDTWMDDLADAVK
ncbi:hypothetical protein [Fimbriiglobus ruber]|uniref:Uncharacterized protein n=1 Tax=Fimbriiglobus ruber TaxID=1908690 RepID=A0A225DUX9_9BACT|nr:hypothetical protein [Fimbriiglobus ruber]OWK45141.1 hypothetical protein FRUB_01472 [Fimbriiglobus ruber]